MIRNGAVGRVLERRIVIDLALVVTHGRMLCNLVKERTKGINVVVGRLVLQNRHQPFQTHASVDMLGGEERKALFIPVELNKDNVPNLNDVWVIGIDQRSCVAIANSIVVNL